MPSYCLEELGLKQLALTDALRLLEEVHFRMPEPIRLHVNAGYILTTARWATPPTMALCPCNDCSFQFSRTPCPKCFFGTVVKSFYIYSDLYAKLAFCAQSTLINFRITKR